jgi:quinol monooxygenase YgiN
MDAKQLLVIGASALASSLVGSAVAQGVPHSGVQVSGVQDSYVRVAELEIDPAQLEAYKAAVKEEIEASVRLEMGVLGLYAVAAKHDPAHIRVFEIYTDEDAYKAHLETPHFRKYKSATEGMVKQLTLMETIPIMLAAKATSGGR